MGNAKCQNFVFEFLFLKQKLEENSRNSDQRDICDLVLWLVAKVSSFVRSFIHNLISVFSSKRFKYSILLIKVNAPPISGGGAISFKKV
ncbi:hypothetical protein Peur_034772 [Populus x canadensis]